ncbi:MAG: 1,4-dihydroxy-6-naphthoate synthase [Pirellulaceae bacterium]|jgi:1,4-dihydroxy-6-naphthoate synthase
MKLQLAISTCPNDTFMFHAIIHKKIDLLGLEFDIQYMDVQELNELLARGELDCSKASFHAALHLANDYGVLPAGAALGRGVGPVLLTNVEGAEPTANSTVCCPGAWTTAKLLFQFAYPQATRIEHRVFSEIMPSVQSGTCDFGVVIHEGRFTYQNYGLFQTADLGEVWESRTGCPVPLGGILAKRSLPADVQTRLGQLVRQSVEYGFANRDETLATMKLHSQEMDDEVIWAHVDLYVNDFSIDLGEEGASALKQMAEIAKSTGLVAMDVSDLQLL